MVMAACCKYTQNVPFSTKFTRTCTFSLLSRIPKSIPFRAVLLPINHPRFDEARVCEICIYIKSSNFLGRGGTKSMERGVPCHSLFVGGNAGEGAHWAESRRRVGCPRDISWRRWGGGGGAVEWFGLVAGWLDEVLETAIGWRFAVI